MQRIFIRNALKYTPAGGAITISLDCRPDRVAVAVADTGCGIEPEHLYQIFEPFFSTKAPKEGTGLGLYVTREIIAKLGGTIEVDSRLGHGTRFDITMPDQHSLTPD